MVVNIDIKNPRVILFKALYTEPCNDRSGMIKTAKSVQYQRPDDGDMMYTDIDFEYHSHLSTIFNFT